MQPVNRTALPVSQNVPGRSPGPEVDEAHQKIEGHSLAELRDGVNGCLVEEMNRTFNQTHGVADVVGTHNQIMLSALQAVSRTLRAKHIQLSDHEPFPTGVEALVQHAYGQTVAVFNLDARGTPIEPQKIELRLDDIEVIQRAINTSNSPLTNIHPEHRWRMCLDPKVIDAIERNLSGARDNKLLRFAFDNQTSFLSGVLEGLAVSMEHLETPLNADFLDGLHQVCCEQFGVEPSLRFSSGFGLTMGDNMTVAGRGELLAFVRELRQTLPAYVAVENEHQFARFKQAFENRRSGEAMPMPPEPTGDHVLLKHSNVAQGRLLMQADVFIRNYERAMENTHDPERRLEHIVDLCQRLERLHPFTDGNCRTICNVFLNHLLVRNGMPLTLLNDPNVLDGWSRDEVIGEVKAGWERAAQYSRVPDSTAFR